MVDGYADRFDDVDAGKVLDALQILRTASRLIRELEAYFARHDLSQLRFLTLIVIDREPDRDSLAVSDIADRLDVSRPVVTRTLQGLEKAGLIRISHNESDARSRNISLSDSGKSTLERVLPGYFAILHRHVTGADG
ncbi:MarR family winged helix-turn-helix transcriptional regulator [Qipengyuania qiaonensis]|nr:MarR family transcriptional regulator [Qipengyuania qiaonensis]